MKKIPLWKNAILIIALVVIIVVAVFSWFVTGPRALVSGLTSDVGEASFIEISADDGDHWNSDLDMEIGVNRSFKEMSGDGTQFFTPVYEVLEKPSGGFVPTITMFEKLNSNDYYYEHVFTFRSNASHNIYLAPESYVHSATENGTGHIAGAIRVAFFELDQNNKEILKCIWAPNSNIAYSPETGTFSDDGPVESHYYYQISEIPVDIHDTDEALAGNVVKISTADGEVSENCADCGYDEENKFMWSCHENLPSNAPSLLSIDADHNGSEKKMLVRVWLEGYDRECVSEIKGERFIMNFEFDAIKENNDE